MISFKTVEGWRRGPSEHVSIALWLEQAKWHRSSRTDCRGIGNPALHPVRFEALFRQQEVRCRGDLVMRRIACGVALQARRRRRREQTPRHVVLLARQSPYL